MLLNEYRLNPARKQDQEVIVKHMEQFSLAKAPRLHRNTCRRLTKNGLQDSRAGSLFRRAYLAACAHRFGN